jgi:hypothetical protein
MLRLGVVSKADERLMEAVERWLAREVRCVFGRREYAMKRYAVAICGSPAEFEAANAAFVAALRDGRASACLYVHRDQARATAQPSVAAAVRMLREDLLAGRLADDPEAAVVSQPLTLPCPVTGEPTAYPDFDLVAFYPQALNELDPVYDPSNHAPVVCINQASDLYGFALMTRELLEVGQRRNGVAMLEDAHRDQVIEKAKRMWQDMASRTIEAFGEFTNPSRLCPAHVSADQRYYVTQHDEAAFGEAEKLEHYSEMPVIYLERLIREWRRFFERKAPPDLSHVMRPALCPMRVKNGPKVEALRQRAAAMAEGAPPARDLRQTARQDAPHEPRLIAAE